MAATNKKTSPKPSHVTAWRKLIESSWLFPALLGLLLLVLTGLKISGSSVGMWNQMLYGTEYKDPDLLAGHPRTIRSDEWELNTPMTVGQHQNSLQRINQNIGRGQDMSLTDVPNKDWSTFFEPHNWPFFVLPLEHAFAMKWWLLGFALMVCCYHLFLFFNPGRRLWAALFAVGFFFSPFLQWWSLGTITLTLYGMAVLLAALYVLRPGQNRTQRLVYAGVLAYLTSCFGLLLYPPFQIPLALVITAFVGGYFMNMYQLKGRKYVVPTLRMLIIPGGIALVLLVLFLATRLPAIKAMNGTVYPGHRSVASGGFEFSRFFSGPVQGQLQDDQQAVKYAYNQSEAATFILFPFLWGVLAWIGIKYRRGKQTDWRIVGLLAVATIFLARMFLPFFPVVPKVLLLDAIPHSRLLIGWGLIHVLTFIVLIEHLQKKDVRLPSRLVLLAWAGTFASFCIAALQIKQTYPEFIGSLPKILAACLITSLVVPLLLRRYYAWALGLLVAVSFASSYAINPLYRGLGPLVSSPLSRAMQDIGSQDKDAGWVVAEPGTFENMAVVNGLRSLSGVYVYPQHDIWKPLEKQPADKDTYNRFAHVFFTIDDSMDPGQSSLDPPALDAFRARTSPCSDFLKQNNIKYILTTQEHRAACVTKVRDVPYPAQPFKIYEIKNP